MICSVLGECAVTHKACKKWFQRFGNGDFDISDRQRAGQPKKIPRRGTRATPGEKSYSNGKKTCARSRSYSASNFPSLASIRKNSKRRPMAEDTELICKPNT